MSLVNKTKIMKYLFIAICHLHDKSFISADFEAKKFRQFFQFLAKIFCLKIGRNENFIMQMAYGDKKIFFILFRFIIEKFDFLVEMPPEREVL